VQTLFAYASLAFLSLLPLLPQPGDNQRERDRERHEGLRQAAPHRHAAVRADSLTSP
jgi:hypothetical protein